MSIKKYEKLMKRCIKLAEKGRKTVPPNPMVGAIIFDDDFRIISEAYHQKYGDSHAEPNAIKNTKENLKGKSLAVNLEPCSHHGKNPPCADLIIKKGFKRVIIGTLDPNPLVSGKGIEKLKKAGIEVITHILEDECKKLNEVFLKNQTEKKPFVTIKTATTLDGKIACSNGHSKWITNEKSRQEVQKLRSQYCAVMTGSNTVIADNPKLNCRMKNSKNPIRIVVDSKLKTPPESLIYNDDNTKIFIITDKNISENKIKNYPNNVDFIFCDLKNDYIDLNEAMQKLYELKITSILVEAGSGLNYSLIKENLADKLLHFIAPKIIGDKMAKNFVEGFCISEINKSVHLTHISTKTIKSDIISEYLFNKEYLI